MPKKIDTQVREVLDSEPITTGAKAKVDITEVYHECLAKCYANREWREYMENLINALVRDLAHSFENIEVARYKQGKIVGIKELLGRSKLAFEMSNKISKVKSLNK